MLGKGTDVLDVYRSELDRCQRLVEPGKMHAEIGQPAPHGHFATVQGEAAASAVELREERRVSISRGHRGSEGGEAGKGRSCERRSCGAMGSKENPGVRGFTRCSTNTHLHPTACIPRSLPVLVWAAMPAFADRWVQPLSRIDDIRAREGRVVFAASDGAVQVTDVIGVSSIKISMLLLQIVLPESCRPVDGW